MNNNHSQEIKKEVEKFFQVSTFNVEISVTAKEESFLVEVKTDDPKILIGEKGQTLVEIQHLLRILMRKKLQENILLELDINDYKKRKEEALKEIARDVADEVSFYKKEKAFPPMSSYERRIVHLALQNRDDIKTESVDDPPYRKVVVKPQ